MPDQGDPTAAGTALETSKNRSDRQRLLDRTDPAGPDRRGNRPVASYHKGMPGRSGAASSPRHVREIEAGPEADPAQLAEEKGLLQVSDEGALEEWVDQAIAAEPQAADDVRNGKMAAIGRLVGAVMKA